MTQLPKEFYEYEELVNYTSTLTAHRELLKDVVTEKLINILVDLPKGQSVDLKFGKLGLQFRNYVDKNHQDYQCLKELKEMEDEKALRNNRQRIEELERELEMLKTTDKGRELQEEIDFFERMHVEKKPVVFYKVGKK